MSGPRAEPAQGIVARVTIVEKILTSSSSSEITPPTVPGSLRVVSTFGLEPDHVVVSVHRQDPRSRDTGRTEARVEWASTTQTSTMFSSLSCGTADQLGVDAVDPVGNWSPRAVMTATTAACTETQAPSMPTNVVVGQRTGTSIALSWGASTDNTGVTEYGLYEGAALARRSSSRGTNGIVSWSSCGRNDTLELQRGGRWWQPLGAGGGDGLDDRLWRI